MTPTTPQPGAPMSSDDVKLLRAGDWLRDRQWGAVQFDRFDDSERRAFMTGTDGQVRLLVPAERMTFLGRPAPTPGLEEKLRAALEVAHSAPKQGRWWPEIAEDRKAIRRIQNSPVLFRSLLATLSGQA